MPKPFTEHPGSGMHTHLSLFEGDRNAFYEAGAEYQLSKVGRVVHRRPAAARAGDHRGHQPVGQLLQAACYRRRRGPGVRLLGPQQPLGAGPRADVQAAARASRRGSSSARSTRACNPYLAYALLLAAGLKGIEEGYELPPGAEDDVWALTEAERRALGIEPLPQNLAEAIAVMERSELVAETLGEHVFDFFLRNKRAEWEEYRRQVTAFELDRYLPRPLSVRIERVTS